MSGKETSLSVVSIIVILATSLAVVTLGEWRIFGIAQGQGNLTKGNVTLTPQQVAAICNPNNPKLNFVNTTESKLCGIPKTITNTTSANMTTANITGGTEAPPPAANPSTGE
jgi:hypothetical protein